MSDKNSEDFVLPSQGFVFWPVGTGDSTTIAVTEDVVMQVDLRHMECANEDDDPHTPIVDRLVELLPEIDEEPYLSVFALTHPDEDHCLGFADLLKQVKIGEIWFTPRIFREYKKDLCDDAKAFEKEVTRRMEMMIENDGDVESGDRVRIIGYDTLLEEDDYEGFPDEKLTIPGNEITELDGTDHSDSFRAFVHAPFKDDSSGERNDASLGLQVSLTNGTETIRALLLGDLCYPTIKRIFDVSDEDDLKWNILLAPHHCSKSIMYWKDEDDEEETLRQDILDQIEGAAQESGYIVASSEPIPASNEKGDNPPHAKAKERYEEIAPSGFFCTQENPSEEKPEPIIFALGEDGLESSLSESAKSMRAGSLSAAVSEARGSGKPPVEKVGFGSGV